MRRRIFSFMYLGGLIGLFLVAGNRPLVYAQEPQPVPPLPSIAPPVDTGQPVPLMSGPQLDNLVAPIALYPDPVLSQVLVASTYPLEVVEAYQWLQANPGLTGPALTQAAQQQNWDPSVQALVMLPDVLRQLNQDITWTTSLGNAYLAQPQDVMNSIQHLRLQAQQAGQLASTPQQTVTVANAAAQPEVIIEPTNPSVIYVPMYDPAWFWGPAIYYPYPHWYYPRRADGLFFSFGPGINVGAFFGGAWGGWGSWGWRPAWGRHTVVVNNTFIDRHHFNAARIPNRTGTSVWSHDAFHRHGVPYPAQALTQRYRPNVQQNLRPRLPEQARLAPPIRTAPRAVQPAGAFARPAPAARAAQPQFRSFRAPNEPMGARQVAPNIPSRNRSVFSGIENGGAARSHISRGYSSLGPGRAAAPRSAPSGGRSSGGRSSGGRSQGGSGGGHHR